MLALVGWLIVIVLIFFIVIYIVFDIVGRAFDFAEANPLTVAVYALVVLVVLLVSLKPSVGPHSREQSHARPFGACGPALVGCPSR
jgi:uncharacterized PurR-regulated membrane protein YhhQ (DUF165 family)